MKTSAPNLTMSETILAFLVSCSAVQVGRIEAAGREDVALQRGAEREVAADAEADGADAPAAGRMRLERGDDGRRVVVEGRELRRVLVGVALRG